MDNQTNNNQLQQNAVPQTGARFDDVRRSGLLANQIGSIPARQGVVIDATSDESQARDLTSEAFTSPQPSNPNTIYSGNNGAQFAGKGPKNKIIAIAITVLVLMLILGFGLAATLLSGNDKKNTEADSKKAVTSLSNEDLLAVTTDSGISGASKVSINGPLQVNDNFVVKPSTQPKNAQAGQIYFDEQSKQFTYFDGQTFQSFVSSTVFNQLSDFARAQAGTGLTLAGGSLNNSGVLSLQGQTGAVTLTSGQGVGVEGTTIRNTGVLSLQGSSGAVSLTSGTGINLNGLQIENTGVTALNGTAGQVSVSATSGSIVISLPQSIATNATPTFGGVNLTTALGISSGGTGSAAYNNNGVIYYDGSKFVSTVTPSAGLCLISNSVGVPEFGSCSGGASVTSLNSLTGGINLLEGNGITITKTGNDLTITAQAANGVTTLNGLNGALTISNATTSGSNIVINDATASAKGIASFATGDFSVANGAVSLGTSITKRGNAVNGASQLVLLDSSGFLPALNASALTSLNADNITSGTLSVVRGGTGTTSFTSKGVLYGNGTGSVQATAAGTTGQCLVIDGSGNPVFSTCTGAGGVSSVNSKNGAVSIQGGTAIGVDNTGATIVINNTGVTSLLGTTNQVSVSSGTGSVTLSLPQAIGLTSNVTFGQATLGVTGTTAGRLVLNGGTSNSVALVAPASPANGLTFTLPSTAGSANDCLRTNGSGELSFSACTSGGSGGGITGSGTTNRLAKFSAGQTIANSNISDDGTTVSITSGAAIQGSAGLFLGTASVAGNLVFSDGSSNTTSLKAASTASNLSFTLPDSAGSSGQCIKTDGSGVLSFGNCLGGGSGSGVNSITGSVAGSTAASGSITINDATTTGSAITISTASNSVKGIASFNSSFFDVNASGAVSVKNDSIALGTNTTGNYVATITAGNGIQGSGSGEGSAPTIALGALSANWNQTGAFDIVLDNANAQLKMRANSGGALYGNFDVDALTADRTYTFPNASGTVCLTSGNCTGANGGGVTSSGTSGHIALFDGSGYSLADSIITQSTGTISVGGTLSATNLQGNGSGLTDLDAADITAGILATNRGGTGVATTATNGQLLIGNGSGYSLATISAGTGITIANGAGTITISAPNAGTCSGCASAGNVVNSIVGSATGSAILNGAVTINDSSSAGSAITINSATNSTKGIASFSSTFFDVTSGDVSIKDGSIALGTKTSGTLATSRGGTGVTTTATNGQLLIGNGSGYTLSTLSAGTGVTITNAAGAITISVPGAGTCSGCASAGDVVNSIIGSVTGSVAAKGALKLNDSSSTASEITINTASTTVKGIASFSSSFFDVSTEGAVTVKNDAIALGTKTTGNYVATIGTGNGLSVTNGNAEGGAATVSLALRNNGGLVADANGLGLITSGCTDNQMLRYTAANGWTCVSVSTSTPTLQQSYDAYASNPAIIGLNATQGGLTIRDNATPLTTGASLFSIQNNAGTTDYLKVTTAGVSTSGNITATGGATISGAETNINANSNFNTNINTGTSTGAVSIGSTTAGAIALQSNTGISIGTGGTTGAVTIGNTTGGVTQNVSIGANATTGSVTNVSIGSAVGTSATTIRSGTGNLALNAATITTDKTSISLFDTTATTVTSFGAATLLTLGGNTASNTVNLGNGTIAAGQTGTINIGTSSTGSGKTAVTIGSTNGASSTLIQGGSGNITLNAPVITTNGTTYRTGSDYTIDLLSTTANTVLTVSNSNSTYAASLNVEGFIQSGTGIYAGAGLYTGGTVAANLRLTNDGTLQNVKIGAGPGVVITGTGGSVSTLLLGTGNGNKCVGTNVAGDTLQFNDCSGSGGGSTGYQNGGNTFTAAAGNATIRQTGQSFNSALGNPSIGLTGNSDLDVLTNNISRIKVTAAGEVKILSAGNSTEQFVVRNASTGNSATTAYALRVDTSSDTLGRVGIGLLTGNAPQVRLDIGGNSTSTGRVGSGGIQIWASGNPGLSVNGGVGEGSVSSGRIYFDDALGKFRVSERGGAYVDLVQGGGVAGFLVGGNNGANGSGGGGVIKLGNRNSNSSHTDNFGLLIGNAQNNNDINSGFRIDYNGNYVFNKPYIDNDQYGFKIEGDNTGVNGALHVDTRYNVVAIGNISSNSTTSYGKLIVEGGIMSTGGFRVGTGSEDIGIDATCSSSQQTIDGPTFKKGILVKFNGCRANNSDLAEAYNNNDNSQPGELVMMSETSATTVDRATAAKSSRLMGIISTAPSQTLGTAQVPNGKPIALVGRVPTRVNTEGGAINVGDKITISSVAGVGKKATGRGMVVGTAMESFNGTGTGSIEVFVNTSFYDPTDGSNMQADAATFGSLNVSGMTTLTNLTVTGNATFQGNITVNGHIISAGSTPAVAAQNGVTATVEGTDTAGTVTITVTTPVNANTVGKVTFANAYGAAPRVSLTPDSALAANSKYYTTGRTATGFDIAVGETLQPGTYTYNYQVIQ